MAVSVAVLECGCVPPAVTVPGMAGAAGGFLGVDYGCWKCSVLLILVPCGGGTEIHEGTELGRGASCVSLCLFFFLFFPTLLAFGSLDFTALGQPVTVRSVSFGL